MDEFSEDYAIYSVYCFNLFFVLTGVAIIVLGSSLIASYHTFEAFFSETLDTIPIIVIIIGCIVFVISCFAFFGAIRQNPRLLMTLAFVMCVILLAEIALATTASIDHRALKETLRTGFLYTIHTYEANKDAWDYVQKEFGCCGVTGYADWKNTSLSYPRSCYRPPDFGHMYAQGCHQAVYSFLESKVSYLAGACAILGVIMLFGLACAGTNMFAGTNKFARAKVLDLVYIEGR